MKDDLDRPWTEIDEHLRQARNLIGQISPETRKDIISGEGDSERLLALYQLSEKRANEAVARHSKLERESKLLKAKTEESIRQIQRLAYRDSLTGLANSNLLKEYLRSIVSNRSPGSEVLLILVDLDRFFVVNEVLGSRAGDQLLLGVAERLSGLVGPSDAIGRRGEDEFMLIFSDVPFDQIEERFVKTALEIKRNLATPFLIEDQKFEITVSIGGSYLPSLAPDIDTLVAQADSALSYVKKQGRDQYYVYSPHLKTHLQRYAMLEFQMRQSLNSGEFFIEYLPILEVKKKRRKLHARIVGAEALVRWDHKIEGFLPPSEFLPLAERNGFIVPLGYWVLDQVCRQMELWRKQGLNIFATMNLSGRQLLQVDVVDEFTTRVSQTDIEPSQIALEFRDSFATLTEEHIDSAIAGLSDVGFSLALDNFGTGFSSLRRLSRARFLKLSPQLVQGDKSLCERAIRIAIGMGIMPIGVGVERIEEVEFLLKCGCELAQGFFFSKSVTADALLDYHKTLK